MVKNSTGLYSPDLGIDQNTMGDEPFNGDVVRFYDDAKLSSVSEVCLHPVEKIH